MGISHGLNKLVTNLNNKEQDDNEQETSEMQFEDCALKSNVVCEPIKAKAKPQRRISASSSKKKQQLTLLRHGGLLREDDGAIVF